MLKPTQKEVREFLQQSNFIEDERSGVAMEDSLRAWKYAINFKEEWNVNFILKVHRLLMRRIRPDIAGKLRDCDVWIGGKRKIFISEALLKEELKTWLEICDLKKIIDLTDEEKWEEIKFWHVWIENVHPQEDGNGRLFRLLMNIQRLKVNLPVKIIHEGIEQRYYYEWFSDKDILDRIGR